jgi:hypothetical protein
MRQHFCILEIAFQDSFSFEHVMFTPSPRYSLFEKMVFTVAMGGGGGGVAPRQLGSTPL